MSLAKKKYIEASRKRVKEKLDCIKEQADIIVSYVNGVVNKAEDSCDELLNTTNKTQFLEKFIPVMNKLEEYHNLLFLLNASVPDEDDGISDSDSDDDTDDGGDDNEKSKNKESNKVEQAQKASKISVAVVTSKSKDFASGDKKSKSRDNSAIKDSAAEDAEVLLESENDTSAVQIEKSSKKKAKESSLKSSVRGEKKGNREESAEKPMSKSGKSSSDSPQQSTNSTNAKSVTSDQNAYDLQNLETKSNTSSQAQAVGQAAPVPGNISNMLTIPVLQLLMSNPALAANYQPGLPFDLAAVLAQTQASNVAKPKQSTPQISTSQPDDAPGHEGMFKLPLTKENLAKMSSETTGSMMAQEQKSGSAGHGGSVTVGEGDGQRAVESGDASVAETGSSGLPAEHKKSRHPTRRRLTRRQKPEKSSKETEDGGSNSMGPSDAASSVNPGSTDLSLLADDYGDGPLVTTLTLTEGKLTEAYVIDVTSPWLFWLQPASHKLKRLMTELNQFEDLLQAGSAATRPPRKLKAGMVVCAQYSHDMHWYRALVLSVQRIGHEKQMEVLYLDYGNREFLQQSQIRPLMPQFADLPCQAFPVGLSEVAPEDGTLEWNVGTASFMTSLSGSIVSTLVKKIDQCPVVLAEVFKQTSSGSHKMTDYFSFAQRLIENKLAVQASNKKIVQFYDMLAQEEDGKDADASIIFKMREYILLTCACPEVKPRKEEKIVVPAETGETLASKMKTHEKAEKSQQITMGKKTSMARINSPEDEEILDDDLDSMLDLELGKRTSVESKDESGPSRNRLSRLVEKSEEKKSDQAKTQSMSKSNQQWLSWDLQKHDINNSEKTDLNATTSGAVNQPSSVKSRSRLRRLADQNSSQELPVEKADKDYDSLAVDRALSCKDVRSTSDQKKSDTKSDKISTSPVKSEAGKNTSDTQAAGVEKFPSGAKSPKKKKGKSKSKQVSDDASLHVLVEAKQSSGEKQLQEKVINKQSQQKVSRKEAGDQAIRTSDADNERKKVDAISRVKEETEKSASSTRDLSDARSDISNTSGIVKDDSSLDSPPASPDVKQLSWDDFLHAGIEGYPPVEVKAPADGFIVCLMSSIDSPSQFYVHLAYEGCATAVDQLFKEVNDYFKEHNVVALQKFFEPVLYDRCVARFKEDDMLYRAKIIQVGDGVAPTKFRVFFMDYGNREWVDKDDIYPLPPKFTTIAPLAVCCMLPEVQPKEGSKPLDSESAGWSSEAIDQFKFLTGYTTPLQLHILLFHDEIISVHEEAPLGVKLTNVEGDEDVWIAHELVNGGFADPTDLFGISNKSITEYHTSKEPVKINEKDVVIDSGTGDSQALKEWTPMDEDFTSIRNSYKVDIADAGVALMGYTPQDEKNVCRYFDMGKPCPRGDFCPYRHVKTEGVMTTDKVEVFAVSDGELNYVAPEAGSWVVVEITAVYSPAHFYVSFPYGPRPVANVLDDTSQDEGYADSADGETFPTLRDSMNEHYQRIRFRDIDMTVLANGEIVAAKFLPDNQWYRARIIDTDPVKYRVKVFYLDFGNCDWLDERDTRQMQNRFMHLPFQAMECHMALEPAKGRKWSQEAIDYIYDLVDGKDFYAEVKESYGNSVLNVELWHTVNKNGNLADLIVEKGYARRLVAKTSPRSEDSKSKKKPVPSLSAPRYRPG